jgi:hypothetical protein
MTRATATFSNPERFCNHARHFVSNRFFYLNPGYIEPISLPPSLG